MKRSEAKPTITSQEGASNSPSFDKFVIPPRERGGFVKVGKNTWEVAMKLKSPYLLFLGNAEDLQAAKTANGILQWAPEKCLGQIRLKSCKVRLPIPEYSLEEAYERGARTLIIGVANRGGLIEQEWLELFHKALGLGFDIANGLHESLLKIDSLATLSEKSGVAIFEVRHPQESFPIGDGKIRSGKRLLTVGTDCSIGKMYTSLHIVEALKKRGLSVNFRATGQTGMFIAGEGLAIDGVRGDFLAGAIEALSPAMDENHWDIIEGQGSLLHPSYAGVSLALLHGSQADVLIMCHQLKRQHMRGLPHRKMPDLNHCLQVHLEAAKLIKPQAYFLGISLNTSNLPEKDRVHAMEQVSQETGLLCFDPSIGNDKIVEKILDYDRDQSLPRVVAY